MDKTLFILTLTVLWLTALPLEGANPTPNTINLDPLNSAQALKMLDQTIAGDPTVVPTEQKKAKKAPKEDMEKQLSKLKNPFIPQIPGAITETPLPLPKKTPTNIPVTNSPRTRPSPKEQIVKPNYPLAGLIWNTDRPQAILNGKIVGLGDTIDQWTITHIDKTGVEVSYQDKKYLIEPQGVNYAK